MELTLKTAHGDVLAFASIDHSHSEIRSIGSVSPSVLQTISQIISICFVSFLVLLKETALLETIRMNVSKHVQTVPLPISQLVSV